MGVVFAVNKDIPAYCLGSIGLPHLQEGDSNDVVFPVLFYFGVLQHLV